MDKSSLIKVSMLAFICLIIFITRYRFYLENKAYKNNSMYRKIKKTIYFSTGDQEEIFIIQKKNFTFLYPVWLSKFNNGHLEYSYNNSNDADEKIHELHKHVIREEKIVD